MKNSVLCIVAACVLASVMTVGCVTGTGTLRGATPEEEISAQLEKWCGALENQDIDAIMALFSDKFEHEFWGDKAGARTFIQEAKDLGYLDDVTVVLDEAVIKVDGTMGSVYPVDVTGNFGTIGMELIVTRENGVWLLIGLDAPGLM